VAACVPFFTRIFAWAGTIIRLCRHSLTLPHGLAVLQWFCRYYVSSGDNAWLLFLLALQALRV